MEKDIGAKIRKARAVLGLSQEAVADSIGMSAGNYGKIERGEINVTIKHLEQIASLLQIPISSLYGEDKSMESKPIYSEWANADFVRMSDTLRKVRSDLDKTTDELNTLKIDFKRILKLLDKR